MIIVKIIGGLGNQMFQYAMGKYIENTYQIEVKYDIRSFEKYLLRKYELESFNINAKYANNDELRRYTNYFTRGLKKVGRYLGVKNIYYLTRLLQEDNTGLLPQGIKITDNLYLDGYWQNYLYVSKIQSLLRMQFTLKEPLHGLNAKVAESISSNQSIAMHIRRGDYVTNPDVANKHGLCSIEYYNRCINSILKKVDSPRLFIFTDDPDWARNNINYDIEMEIVDHNGSENACVDLILMSMCKYHIIANSSFSWWSAWLSSYPSKNVYAPKIWFADRKVNIKSNYIIPESWNKY